MSLVSIIIPTYNALPYVKDTLLSALNQSYENKEIIVIDDGSTDGTFDYVSSLKHSNLFLYRNQQKGACAARNFGIKIAKGDFIQFLDADDILSEDKIKKQVELLNQFPNRVAVCSTIHFIGDIKNGTQTDAEFLYSTNEPHVFLLKLYGGDGCKHNMVSPNAWLTPKHIINKAGAWDELLIKDQDGEYFCRVLMASEGICYEPNVINYYRRHIKGNNISSGKSKEHIYSQLKALDSKSRSLFSFSHLISYQNAFALQYKLIAIDAYPQFIDLYTIAIQKSQKLKIIKYTPTLGGRIIELVKIILGWRAARRVSYIVHKYKFFKIFTK